MQADAHIRDWNWYEERSISAHKHVEANCYNHFFYYALLRPITKIIVNPYPEPKLKHVITFQLEFQDQYLLPISNFIMMLQINQIGG